MFLDEEGYDPDETLRPSKQVVVGICSMAKKSQSKPMKEILSRLEEFELIRTIVFQEEVILNEPVSKWPLVDCLISFHSKGFPLAKAVEYEKLREPFVLNDLNIQYSIQDRRKVYKILEKNGIELPRYAVIDRDTVANANKDLVEHDDHIEIGDVIFNKPFVEKPVSAEDHNIYIYYPSSAGGGSQRLFRKIGSRSSVYSSESRVRKAGSYIYEEFMPTDGTDVKVYTVGPDYAHAEARKSPALDGKVERDKDGKEIRYPIILSNLEKLIARNVCLAFKQTVCGFDLLRANGKSYVCDVNGFSFVKNSLKYYDDSAKIVGNVILRALAPQLRIPWSIPFQLDDPPIVETTFGKMMELCCAIAIIRHSDRTPKQKMKMEVKDKRFFDIFEKNGGYKSGHTKLKRPRQLQEILDIARSLLNEFETNSDNNEIKEDRGKLDQLKSILEMYGHFSGINRKIQLKYQQKEAHKEPSLMLIIKWDGELTPAGRVEAEELGRAFRCMYPGGQGQYAGTQGLGLLRLHSTFRHDLKIYASDEGRVQTTAAAFAKGLLALEGELTPILAQMVKSANTNGLLDNDCESSKLQNQVKKKLHEKLQQNWDFSEEDYELLNPTGARSIENAMNFIKNPHKICEQIFEMVQELNVLIKEKREKQKSNQEYHLYHGETWELLQRRWSKLEKDFKTKNETFDISKIPDIYDCIKYDLRHNRNALQFPQSEQLYVLAKAMADIVIPQEYGMSKEEKLSIGLGICGPLLKKIRGDLLRDYNEEESENVNRLNPHYSEGVSSPGRHVKTRLYFTSESHIHSLLTVLRYGGLLDTSQDEQWRRAMQYVSAVPELNYLSQIVIMLYEDSSKDLLSEDRFHLELHFSPGVVCSVQQNYLPKGPGFRPGSRANRSADIKLTLPIKNFLNKSRIIKELKEEEITDESSLTSTPAADESGDASKELKAKVKTIQLNRSKSVSPVSAKDCKSDVDNLELSKSLNDDRNLMHQLNKKINSCLDSRRSPCDEPYQESQESIEIAAAQDDEEIIRLGSADKFVKIIETFDSSTPAERYSPPTPKEKKSLSITYDQILKPFPIIRSNSVSNTSPIGMSKKEYKSSISTSLLFSTAVISGSSSAPDLKDVLNPPERCKSQSIRPLETLHNALSLRQMDDFLVRMVNSNLYRHFCTHQRQIKRNIQITPYDADLDPLQLINDLNGSNLSKMILDEIAAKKNEQDADLRKISLDSHKSSITGLLMEQPMITKANTISSSSTLTSNLSDISGSNSQLQVLSGPNSIISSSSVPSSPNDSSGTHVEFWQKSFFNRGSIDHQSDTEQATTSLSGPPSPMN